MHRIRWGDVLGDRQETAHRRPAPGAGNEGPNWGDGKGVRVLVYSVPDDPARDPWPSEVADDALHTIHNLQAIDFDGDGSDEIVMAGWEGVFVLNRDSAGHWSKTQLGTGNQDSKPNKGSSEVKVGTPCRRPPLHRHDRALARIPGRRLHARRPIGTRASGIARSSTSPCSGATPSGAPTSTATATRS